MRLYVSIVHGTLWDDMVHVYGMICTLVIYPYGVMPNVSLIDNYRRMGRDNVGYG